MDPRLEPRETSPRVTNRKALQLCGQVQQALSLALAECGDDVLRDVSVVSVVPTPTSVRLLVSVHLLTLSGQVDAATVAERLGRAQGLLRREVSAAVHRRKAPELLFRVVGPDELR
jgi:ribosome-binding factor A